MEPISALSLVANIFQELALDKNVSAEDLAEDLRKLTTGLSETQSKWMEAHGTTPLDADETRLRNICERCNETAVELNVQLQKLKVKDGARFRRLKSYRQANISVWREDEVDEVASRLDNYQRELNTHILVTLRKSAHENDIRSKTQFTTLDERTQETILAVLEIDKKLDTRLDDHAELLGRVYENTNQLLTRRTPSPAPPYDEVGSNDPSDTPLHAAAAAGDLLQVKKALRSWGVDINARNEDGLTPLHVAKTGGVVKRLVATDGVRLNVEDDEGRSALHCAVLKQRLWVIKALLEAGIDQTMEDDLGRIAAFYAQGWNAARWMLKYGPETETMATDHLDNTGLFHMAWLGDVEGTQFFIDQKADVNARNANDETALTEASRHGSVEIVKLLLRHGARIEVVIKGSSWTPLTQAVRDNRLEVARVLLDHGAYKHTKLKWGCDAVAEACFRGHHEIARLLIERGAKLESMNHFQRTPLLEASRRNDGDWTRWLLKRGAKLDVRDADGRSPVWHAASGNHHRTLAALLDYGAATETLTNDNWLPLGSAAHHGHVHCVRLLLDAGAGLDVHQAHGSGYTALCEAVHHNRLDVVELLIARGADMERGSKKGFSALSVAAYNGRDDIVRRLATAGANLDKTGFVNTAPEYSETPLLRAIGRGHTSTALLLIELGADVRLARVDGYTALHGAAEKGNAAVASALLARGARVNAWMTAHGETALMLAAVAGSAEVVRVLLDAGAERDMRDWRGCTAWTFPKAPGFDGMLRNLLVPGEGWREEERRRLEEERLGEIARALDRRAREREGGG